jgi:hypothetical protein
MVISALDGDAWSASSSGWLYSYGEGTADAVTGLYHPGLWNFYLLQQWLHFNLGVMVLH